MASSPSALAALVPEKQCELEQTQPRAAPQQQQSLPPPVQQQPPSPLLAALVESPPSSPELLPKRGARKGRQCDACHTTETPMWRRGGKGTLCNACGVRWSLRKKRPPRPGLEGEAGGEALSPLPDSDDPAFGSMLDDEATDPAIAALRSKRESDKARPPPLPPPIAQDYYYCRYCDKTWPLNYFRNSQQFGAHCSNCSRKKRPSPNGETEAVVAKPKRERRDRKRVKREPIPAAPYWSEGDASASPTASPASSRASSAFTSSPPSSSSSSVMSTSPTSSSASRKRERDHSSSSEGAMTKRRSKHHGNGNGAVAKSAHRDHQHHRAAISARSRSGSSSSSGGDSDGEEDDEGDDDDEGAWERLFEKLKGNSARQVVATTTATAAAPAAVSRVLSEEERRREVELLEKEVTLLRYQVRLKEHWHKKSLKEVKHNMEEELHELQKDLIYSFEVAQACIKLELESNEKEETQVLLAFARHISLPPTPQPQSPQAHHQHHPAQQLPQQARDRGSGSEAGSTSSSGTCTPCHDNLDKLRQDGEQLRRSCTQQLAKLKTELEQQFNAKEEIFMRMLGETKTHFSASTQRLRKKIAEIESIIGTLRTSAASDVASPSPPASKIVPPALSVATCQ